MISLITSADSGGGTWPVNVTVTFVVKPEMGWPFTSCACTARRFMASESGTRMEKLVVVVHVSGYSIPLMVINFTAKGASPVIKTKLLVVLITSGFLIRKDVGSRGRK